MVLWLLITEGADVQVRAARQQYGVDNQRASMAYLRAVTLHPRRHHRRQHPPPRAQVWAWATALLFVNIAVPLSLYDIHGHMANYVRPQLQRYYIRCLWMVPIYAIESWLALRFQSVKVYIEVGEAECGVRSEMGGADRRKQRLGLCDTMRRDMYYVGTRRFADGARRCRS